MEIFTCLINENTKFSTGPCLYERGKVQIKNPTCPQCSYYLRYISPASPPKIKLHKKISKYRNSKVPKGLKKPHDLFSDWDISPIQTYWSQNPRTNELHLEDVVFGLEDSVLLDHLIHAYQEGFKESQDKGLEAFEKEMESLFRWRQGDWECLTQEEKKILMAAKDGSIEAIQKLAVANPKMIRLPFIGSIMENLIRTCKFGDGKEIREAKTLWMGFLPKRGNHKSILKEEHLFGILTQIMRITKKRKEDAIDILLDHDPSINSERLRKISVGAKAKIVKKSIK